ncbi:histidinol-phosphate transaminase [Sorangium sp. So ce131]|uniref:histidinol-phosphate transaminase n=1 Tax=Sorangium sp. So ce131 TaxID=3133282 RepID=UPI003F6075BB
MVYERDNIHRLTPYTPGEQPLVADVVKLNTNENPYPPPRAVLEAIHEVSADQLRRYPPPTAQQFRETAAKLHGLSPEQVIATNGGDELLRMAITVYCEPGGRGLGETYPTYSLYDVLAGIHGTTVSQVPLDEDWSVPEDFAAQLNDRGCRLALLVNPHAPSGRLEPLDKLERVARAFRGVLLIDEAYVDFAESDAIPLLDPARGLDNVLLLRTLSKGYSLAGLRFGYGLGHPRIIEALDKARDSYNTDVLSQAAAVAALRSRDEARESWKKVIAERTRLTAALAARGFTVAPSQSNFVLAAPPKGGLSAQALYRALHDRNIFVRYWDAPRIHDRLRITVGTPEQNDALLAAIADITSAARSA